MSPKVLMLVVLGLVNLAGVARAESPASLLEIAPHCRSLVKARFTDQGDETLLFTVERVYVGDELPRRIEIPAVRWRRDWGELHEGFEGFFAYRRDPEVEVDTVFPVQGDQVLVSLSGRMQPLAEVEARLAEISRRYHSLILDLIPSEDDPARYQVIFTNHGKEPIEVSRAGRLEYLVYAGTVERRVEPTGPPPEPDVVELAPGESTSVAAPASLLDDVPAGSSLTVRILYTSTRTGSQWSQTRTIFPSYRGESAPAPRPARAPRPLEVLSTPAPRYTELAKRAEVSGDVRVRATVLPGGTVSQAEVVGAELPMGLGRAGLEAIKTWRFAPSDTEHEEEILFEFRLAGYCDLEPPPFERIGDRRFRVWAAKVLPEEIETTTGVFEDGRTIHVLEAPKCAH
jgi:TonB family protein